MLAALKITPPCGQRGCFTVTLPAMLLPGPQKQHGRARASSQASFMPFARTPQGSGTQLGAPGRQDHAPLRNGSPALPIPSPRVRRPRANVFRLRSFAEHAQNLLSSSLIDQVMETIFNIATRISTPLALAGLFAAIFFFIVRLMITGWFKLAASPAAKRGGEPVDGGAERSPLRTFLPPDLLKDIINKLFILSLVAMVLGFAGYVFAKVYTPPTPSRDYAFWTRSKTGIGQGLVRHAYPTLKECLIAETNFPVQAYLLAGCGCADRQLSVEELRQKCLGGNQTACQMLVAQGYAAPLDRSAVTSVGGMWRFWYFNTKAKKLTDEMHSTQQECQQDQSKWTDENGGPIIYACAEVSAELEEQAKEAVKVGKPYAKEWLDMVSVALESRRAREARLLTNVVAAPK